MSKNGRRPSKSLTVSAKVTNETNSRYWSATSRSSNPDQVVHNKYEITDADRRPSSGLSSRSSDADSRPSSRLSTRPFSNTSQMSNVSKVVWI